MQRVSIIGVSCSGKSTLGHDLAQKKGIEFIDLDDLFWNPNWVQTPKDLFTQRVEEQIQKPSWVIVGNYSSVQDRVLEAADTVVWLDYSQLKVWNRALSRTFKRALFKEPCCNGNVETFKQSFLSKESILLWVLEDYSRRKRKYEELFAGNSLASKNLVRLQTQRETDKFLSSL